MTPRTNTSWADDRPWATTDPQRLVGPGHNAGDFLEADQWTVLERSPGLLVIDAHLPDHLKNPQGQLFGGFTPTYVDMVALHTVYTVLTDDTVAESPTWLTTINMRCDYFEPIVNDRFIIKGQLTNRRGRTSLVATEFLQQQVMAAHAITTIRELPNV